MNVTGVTIPGIVLRAIRVTDVKRGRGTLHRSKPAKLEAYNVEGIVADIDANSGMTVIDLLDMACSA
jgi:hypothetical protein